jgi:RNA polymerase sigma-70 factor (ECF subfamily)
MRDTEWLLERFEERHKRLHAVAYRMLGSLSDADDALQEAWFRLSRADLDGVENFDAWLTTVVGRICLNMLRTRRRQREDPFGIRVPDPIISVNDSNDPAEEVALADSVGLALMVVLETLAPAERLAFVLHDVFAVPFDQIAQMLDTSPAAARQLATRARRRVRGQAKVPDAELHTQQEVVDAFFAAARDGNFEALVAVLDPDVVLISDGLPTGAPGIRTIRGAEKVARASLAGARTGRTVYRALVNGGPGVIFLEDGQPVSLLGFTVVGGKIAEIDAIGDRKRMEQLDIHRLINDQPLTD